MAGHCVLRGPGQRLFIRGFVDNQVEQFREAHAHCGCLLRNDAVRTHARDRVDFNHVRGFAFDYEVDAYHAAAVETFVGDQCKPVHLLADCFGQVGGGNFVRKSLVLGFVVEKFALADQFGDRENILFASGDHHAAN